MFEYFREPAFYTNSKLESIDGQIKFIFENLDEQKSNFLLVERHLWNFSFLDGKNSNVAFNEDRHVHVIEITRSECRTRTNSSWFCNQPVAKSRLIGDKRSSIPRHVSSTHPHCSRE